MKIDKIVWYLAAMVILFAVIKQCEKEPKIITKTETKTIVVKDTITETVIKEVPKTVYVEKIINQKGDTEIVFVKDSTSTSIKSKQYDTTLKSNDASAELKITTSGEILDVSGIITYPKKETTTTITKIKPQSGLFLSAQVPIQKNFNSVGLGLDYQFKNTLLIGVVGSYDNISNTVNLSARLGVKIF